MTTKNPRINVTFEENLFSFLSFIAKQEHKSLSGVVKELAIESLEKREDKQLSQIASELDQPNVKTYNHFDAWK
jgi:metal-responsive CopG/Arc/MetJ family transcriptional regulator